MSPMTVVPTRVLRSFGLGHLLCGLLARVHQIGIGDPLTFPRVPIGRAPDFPDVHRHASSKRYRPSSSTFTTELQTAFRGQLPHQNTLPTPNCPSRGRKIEWQSRHHHLSNLISTARRVCHS